MIRRGILALRPAFRSTKFYLQNRVTPPVYRTNITKYISLHIVSFPLKKEMTLINQRVLNLNNPRNK